MHRHGRKHLTLVCSTWIIPGRGGQVVYLCLPCLHSMAFDFPVFSLQRPANCLITSVFYRCNTSYFPSWQARHPSPAPATFPVTSRQYEPHTRSHIIHPSPTSDLHRTRSHLQSWNSCIQASSECPADSIFSTIPLPRAASIPATRRKASDERSYPCVICPSCE